MGCPTGREGQKLLAVSAGVIIASAFLPWWTVAGSWRLGIDGDGPLTLVFGLTAITIGTLREWSRRDHIAVSLSERSRLP